MRRVTLVLITVALAALLALYVFDYRPPKKDEIGYQQDFSGASKVSAPDKVVPIANGAETSPGLTENEGEGEAAPPAPEGWVFAWGDEFDAPTLNLEYWTEMDRRDNYNGELQYYLPANSYVRDGLLFLEARREDRDGKRYTSGMVQTADKLDFLYGRFEARISLPVGKGFFPAFWLLEKDGKYEIDIMESIGSEPEKIYAVNHYTKRARLYKTYGVTTIADPAGFHEYALEWDRDELRWYVDGELYYSTKKGVPDEKMYLIFTFAVGGVWPGSPNSATVFPNYMVVDYVRYFTKEEVTAH